MPKVVVGKDRFIRLPEDFRSAQCREWWLEKGDDAIIILRRLPLGSGHR